ncbi:DUF5979 domain-containing protein [Pseudobutyrivibrio ruminis]|uniref:DUF5979 domain-containing protein n=1 Tax=Pseudobutyrivibrio ruminis TaxID=46206 RepID=UPI00051C5730|nr:DUF5979 domain-containing protein [Pseudobutyrivibrio ruminis]
MKSLIFKKKNLIAFAMAAVVAVSGFGVYQSQAAEKIDENKQCTITVKVPDTCSLDDKPADSSIVNGISLYDGTLEVDFYKLADVELNGEIGISLAGVDLSDLSKSDVTAEDIKATANEAYKVVKDSAPNYKVEINPSKELSKTVNGDKGVDRGIYLYVVKDFQNKQYQYSFDKYIVMVPYSTTISQGTKVDEHGNIVDVESSDDWVYDTEIALKCKATEIYGNLKITKELKTYNESLGTTPFVFEVEAFYGEGDNKEIVYSNVFSMDFSEPGSREITVEKIPANSTVTVTEVYSGASYKLTSDKTKTTTIVENETSTVEFVNDYDDQTDIGTISIENHFNENGYVDSNINPNSTTTENVETEN